MKKYECTISALDDLSIMHIETVVAKTKKDAIKSVLKSFVSNRMISCTTILCKEPKEPKDCPTQTFLKRIKFKNLRDKKFGEIYDMYGKDIMSYTLAKSVLHTYCIIYKRNIKSEIVDKIGNRDVSRLKAGELLEMFGSYETRGSDRVILQKSNINYDRGLKFSEQFLKNIGGIDTSQMTVDEIIEKYAPAGSNRSSIRTYICLKKNNFAYKKEKNRKI